MTDETPRPRGREFITKWVVIAIVTAGSAGLILSGTFDGVTPTGTPYPKAGAVQVWIAACASAVAAAGVVFAGRSYVWGQRAKNGHGKAPPKP